MKSWLRYGCGTNAVFGARKNPVTVEITGFLRSSSDGIRTHDHKGYAGNCHCAKRIHC